jgi:hypothetical protein
VVGGAKRGGQNKSDLTDRPASHHCPPLFCLNSKQNVLLKLLPQFETASRVPFCRMQKIPVFAEISDKKEVYISYEIEAVRFFS